MTEQDWQARALEVAMGNTAHMEFKSDADAILAFAKDYAAEVTAEVERLKANLGATTKEHDYAVSDVMRLRAEVKRLNIERWDEHIRVLKDNADLRAQLAAAGPLWQPIESAPKDGTTVDLWDRRGFRWTDKHWGQHYWRNGKPENRPLSWGCGSADGPGPDPIYWMPKPAPPKDKP